MAIQFERKDGKETHESQAVIENMLPRLIFRSSILTKDALKKRVDIIVSYLSKHTSVLKLLKEVTQQESVTVEFDLHENMKSTAAWQRNKRRIIIATLIEEPFDIVESLIFELCNAANKPLSVIKFEDYTSEEAYAIAKESAEYHSGVQCTKFMIEGITEFSWQFESTSTYVTVLEKNLSRTLSQCLEDVQKPSLSYHGFAHIDEYREQHITFQLLTLLNKISAIQEKMSVLTRSNVIILAQLCVLSQKLHENQSEIKRLQEQVSNNNSESNPLEKEIEVLQVFQKELELRLQKINEHAIKNKAELLQKKLKDEAELKKIERELEKETKRLGELVASDGKELQNIATKFSATVDRYVKLLQKIPISDRADKEIKSLNASMPTLTFSGQHAAILRMNTILDEAENQAAKSCCAIL